MASDEQFSLCWNNFHANMSAGFHGLLSRGDLVDVTLAAEGRLLQAHKLVLSVCSPYFQEMFKMNPTQHPIVFLKDVSHSALRDLLQFMYQGEVNVKQEELASFISTAEQLQVKGLTGNQNEESSTPSKPKPTSRPGPRSSQQRQSVMTKLETDLDSKPSSTPVAIKRPNRPSIASNNSSSSQSGPVKRKCVDPLEAGPSGSAKEEFVTIPDEDENNAVAPKMEPEFVNESMWDDDDDGTNNDETNFGEDDSNMEMTGFDGSTTGDGNLTGGAEGGAVGDAQDTLLFIEAFPSEESEISVLEGRTSSSDSAYQKKKRRKQTQKKKTKKNTSNIETTYELAVDKTPSKRQLKKSYQEIKQKGGTYINTKGKTIKSKCMKSNPCVGVNCGNNCENISEETRNSIFMHYWGLGSSKKRKDWISQCAIRHSVKRPSKTASRIRSQTFEYYINEGEGRRRVCQKFLIATLDVTQRFILYTLDSMKNRLGFPQKDKRGGHNKTSESVIEDAKEFISSLPLLPSHLCEEDSSKLYLPKEFKNITSLYRIYKHKLSYRKTMSYQVFKSWFKRTYNIGFHVPKKDKC